MDIPSSVESSSINRIAYRQNLTEDVAKLREQLSREAVHIVKTKVSQDTAYWDLKEQLHQTERNNERLRQNIEDVQIQNEMISGQYLNEIRLRPETLNKLDSTNSICNVLENYMERLKETLSRCKNDQATLYDAYQKAGHLFKEFKLEQDREEYKSMQLIENLQEKVKLQGEHFKQAQDYFNSTKQKADAEITDLKMKFATSLGQKDELLVTVNDQARKLDLLQNEIDKKNENNEKLQNDMTRILQESDIQSAELKKTIEKQENENKEALETIESLKKALNNQEEFTKSIVDQNNVLQERIFALEEENGMKTNMKKDLEASLMEVNVTCDGLRRDLALQIEEKQKLENYISNQQQQIESAEAELVAIRLKLSTLETEVEEVRRQLHEANTEINIKTARIEELGTLVQTMESKINDMEKVHKMYKDSTEMTIKELSEAMDNKNKELDSKVLTINELMSQVNTETRARVKLEETFTMLKKDIEVVKVKITEKEDMITKLNEQIEILECVVKNKDIEISQQRSLLFEEKNEKARLNEKFRICQNTLDAVEKQLKDRFVDTPKHIELPENDDNAIMLTPHNKVTKQINPLGSSSARNITANGDVNSHRVQPLPLNTMHNMFSDSSMSTVDNLIAEGCLDATDFLAIGPPSV